MSWSTVSGVVSHDWVQILNSSCLSCPRSQTWCERQQDSSTFPRRNRDGHVWYVCLFLLCMFGPSACSCHSPCISARLKALDWCQFLHYKNSLIIKCWTLDVWFLKVWAVSGVQRGNSGEKREFIPPRWATQEGARLIPPTKKSVQVGAVATACARLNWLLNMALTLYTVSVSLVSEQYQLWIMAAA